MCGSLNILWHCVSLGLEWKLTFSSPVATAEFSKFAGILSAALSLHHLFGFERTQLEISSPPSALPHRVLLIISLSPGYTETPLHTVPRLDLISWTSLLSPGDSEGQRSLLRCFHGVAKCWTHPSNWTTVIATWTFNKWKVENNYILTWWVQYEGIHGMLDSFGAIVPILKSGNSLHQWDGISFFLLFQKLYFHVWTFFGKKCTFSSSQWISHWASFFSWMICF